MNEKVDFDNIIELEKKKDTPTSSPDKSYREVDIKNDKDANNSSSEEEEDEDVNIE